MVETFTFGFNNCYVLSGQKYAILIDTCPECFASALFETVKQKNITLLLLTHGHADHIGCAKYISQKLHIPIAMHQKDQILIQQPAAQKMTASTPFGFVLSQKIKRQKPVPFFQPDIFVSHGQRLEEYGIRGRIFALPGHTEGSIGVWTPNKEFFVGDAIMHTSPLLKPCIYYNKSDMLRSYYNICQSDAVSIYMGHGKAIFRQNNFSKYKLSKNRIFATYCRQNCYKK